MANNQKCNPEVGRFLSVDPMADKAPNWTPYRYCFDNPVNLVDPTGLWETDYVDENNKLLAHTEDGIDRTVIVKDEQRKFFEAGMTMAKNNGQTNDPVFNRIFSNVLDRQKFNATSSIRYNIGKSAIDNEGSDYWSYYNETDKAGVNTYKCNIFAYDMILAGGATAPLRKDGMPLLAGEWGLKNNFITGWTVLNTACFRPMPGDIISEAHDYGPGGPTGHMGVVTGNGRTTSASSITDKIEGNDWGFRPENTNTVIWRYIGR